jgi:hypothetical protein
MRRLRLAATILVTSSFALAATANAQERKGFWFDFGVGVGGLDVSAGGQDGSRDASGIAGLKLGWTLNPQVLAGLNLRSATLDVQGAITGAFDVYNVEATVVYYPSVSSGFFVSGGVGGSFLDLVIEEQGTTLTGNISKGLGLSVGAGYDYYLGRGFSITPAASFWYGRTGDVRFRGQTVLTDWSHNVIDATVSIKFN